MRNVNLIPAPHRAARRRRQKVRWCAAGCSAYALLAVGTGAAVLSNWGGNDPLLGQQLTQLEKEIQGREHELSQGRSALAASESELTAANQMADQPDWSVLLSLLASKAQDQIILRTLQLKSASQPAGGSDPADRLIVTAGGVSRSPLAAQQYVLRLEKTGLFDRVTLVETHRESFLTSDAASFQIECVLSAGTAPKEKS